MNKSSLIDTVSAKTGLSKAAAERAVNAFLGAIADDLSKGERVTVSGFGTFEVRKRKARVGRIPQTGKPVVIPEHLTPAFIAGEGLRKSVRG
ncbi:hypothetical protein COT70_02115 [candidate division WWE3 bacterium CG09_land_8_20_14_0_10_47_33]|uniref:DNA-binding protein n=1 Tax=candidate division WWE3 bacterium CG_4_9_14_0_2_um_filter_48_10 TaxID=1975078 RepID=A0A2M8EJR2_UNCKA|nr:MAG: hypothetical protein COT70_02115 [candidate division WWE3 bacterium CG09_land_8_20_14_0_10_47_33]PIZ41452.1 MAG: hypothetical protein COY35_00365 [candidate division WWE3 bacterium CG_4_10_14_0_2_um_filter_47_8]PJC22960.1 MAG: hypothetical protein CO059_01090 [candidate division WWE3 bacterium CG_4_9_14_0_2_um_filter_48_10]PJE51202.1 MAG: hypothetical protein COV28_02530 [candidate division WWE3 bacterium CG10_big_fil_rev_8_21_14_0_10_48_23]